MSTSVLVYLWGMHLLHVGLPSSISCVMNDRVAPAVEKWKREMNVTLNQCQD